MGLVIARSLVAPNLLVIVLLQKNNFIKTDSKQLSCSFEQSLISSRKKGLFFATACLLAGPCSSLKKQKFVKYSLSQHTHRLRSCVIS